MIKKIYFIVLCALISFMPAKAKAADIICDALLYEDAYKNDKSYKKLVAGSDDWVFRTSTDFKNDFELNGIGVRRFQRLKEAFRSHDMELIIALLPTRGMMHSDNVISDDYDAKAAWMSYQKLAKQLEEQGVSVATASEDVKDFFYKRDHHWKADGARFMAQQVAEKIKGLPIYADITKQEFVTEKGEDAVQEGTFSKFINEKCQSDIAGEEISLYMTAQKNTDLFEDQPKADIVLIGTSNSTQVASKANFVGFLREYIGADVENLSVSGGGADTAFYNWLHADAYKEKKPKIVIWEVPVYQDFDGGPFFRQLVPAVYGACDAIEQEDVQTEEKLDLFSTAWEGEGRNGEDLYASLVVDGKGIRKLRVVTEYEGGRKDIQGVRRSRFYKGNNTFFLEFNQNRPEKIKRFTVYFPKSEIGLEAKASLCSYPDQ